MQSLKILRAVAFVTYKEWAVYRSHVLVSLFVGPAFFIAQLFIWQAVFSTRETIGGLTLEQMITYYGIATLINYIVFDFADWNLQMLIRTGKFLTFMLRPMSHRYFALCQKIGHRILGLSMELIPVYFIITLVIGVRLVPAHWLWAIASALLSFLMVFLINYCIGIVAFWFTNTSGMRMMFTLIGSICAGTFIPLTFFPDWLQKVMLFLPFQYTLYVPTRVFIGSYELGGITLTIPELVGLQALAVVLMWGISEIMWRLGVRRFTGVGA